MANCPTKIYVIKYTKLILLGTPDQICLNPTLAMNGNITQKARHSTAYWTATDGTKLFAQYWKTPQPPLAVVALVHGMGEHSDRYGHMADFFSKNGISFITFDQRGHGRSEGKRGHTPSYAQLMADLELLLKQAEGLWGTAIPLFLYGHSMGGNLVLNYALRHRPALSGVICSSPWLKLAFEPSKFQVWMGSIARKVFPAFSQRSKMDTDMLSHDAAVQRSFDDDALTHDFISAEMFFSVQEAARYALGNADKFPLPLMLFHGSEDHITDAAGSQAFAEKAPAVDFTLWEGCYHEIHNEAAKQRLFAQIHRWISRLLNGKKAS